jgi:phosphatidylglycerophosphate synthase
LLLTAAIGVPRRLLCNLLDGMVAVAGGLGSPSGQVWNDLPDRIGAGHGIAYRWGAALPAGLAAR